MPDYRPDVMKPSMYWHWRSWDNFKATSALTLANYTNIILLVVFVFFAISQARGKHKAAEKASREKRYIKADDFPPVEEQPDFDWKTTEPIQYRPFKSRYHLTMALETLEPSELLVMDNTYADRVAYRRDIMAKHGKHVVNVNDDKRVRPAVVELYRFLMGTYLPLRFPQVFKLHETEYEQAKTFMLENKVTGTLFPARETPQTSTIELIKTLGETIDEDLLFLLPEEDSEDPKYVLEAYVWVCAADFDPADKIGKRLAAIHEPVPDYKSKLEGSMDRFFAKVEVGKYVKRVNWNLATNADLYGIASGVPPHPEGDVVQELGQIDPDNTYIRSERQTLHRLPKSKAVVFGFHTYLYPLRRIKEEGGGEEFIDAIEGLQKGSVPQIHLYKRAMVWGEAVKRYLRS